jgi:Ca-activated chloride channel family protein
MRLNGNMIGYKKDRKGETVITKRNAGVLEEIADIANGLYIDGNVTENPVKTMSEIIANAEKSEFETKQFADYKDQFQWFLGLGILFLLFDIFLFDKKTKWLRKVDLFNEEKTKK